MDDAAATVVGKALSLVVLIIITRNTSSLNILMIYDMPPPEIYNIWNVYQIFSIWCRMSNKDK